MNGNDISAMQVYSERVTNIMKKIKKLLSLLCYLLLVAAFMRFDIRKLIDLKQVVLVLFGMLILYLPNVREEKNREERNVLLGLTALWAGGLQTFVLLFMLLSEADDVTNAFGKIALMCRPLLYGFCIWIIMDGALEKKAVEDGYEQVEPQKENVLDGKVDTLEKENIVDSEENNMNKEKVLHRKDENLKEENVFGGEDETLEKENIIDQEEKTVNKEKVLNKKDENLKDENILDRKKETLNKEILCNRHIYKRVFSAREISNCLMQLGLSKREVEVGVLVTKNMSNAEIAVELCISETTVKKHISNIFGKLEIGRREEILECVAKVWEEIDSNGH